MGTKADLEARILELTRICDKETDRADKAEEKLQIAIQQLRIIKLYTKEFDPHKQATEALKQLGVLE